MLDILNNLSSESNLSISKIINILVEEALYKRGIFNVKNRKVLNYEDITDLNNQNSIKNKNDYEDIPNEFNNFIHTKNIDFKETSDDFIDKEIYEKFLMFLQFQEKMKKRN